MTVCARCDWRPDVEQPTREQLAAHAVAAAHPLCVVCTRSLHRAEPRVCELCISYVQQLLAGILLLWAELHGHRRTIRTGQYDETRPVSRDKPLLGGDVLLLLGPGSNGTSARRLSPAEIRKGMTGREHGVDNQPTDGASVAQVLTSWEDSWRRVWEEPAADTGERLSSIIRSAASYLERRTRAAANGDSRLDPQPEFDAYVHELAELHGQLERVTHQDRRPAVAEADCFTCAGRLERHWREAQACGHTPPRHPPKRLTWLGVSFTREEQARWREQLLVDFAEQHGRCEQGGFEDVWRCNRCHRVYEWHEYLFAVQAKLREQPSQGWSLPEHAAMVLDVPVDTIRSWIKRGQIAVACVVAKPKRDRRMRVWWPEVAERVKARKPRRNAGAA